MCSTFCLVPWLTQWGSNWSVIRPLSFCPVSQLLPSLTLSQPLISLSWCDEQQLWVWASSLLVPGKSLSGAAGPLGGCTIPDTSPAGRQGSAGATRVYLIQGFLGSMFLSLTLREESRPLDVMSWGLTYELSPVLCSILIRDHGQVA